MSYKKPSSFYIVTPKPTPWARLEDHCWTQTDPWPDFLNSMEDLNTREITQKNNLKLIHSQSGNSGLKYLRNVKLKGDDVTGTTIILITEN